MSLIEVSLPQMPEKAKHVLTPKINKLLLTALALWALQVVPVIAADQPKGLPPVAASSRNCAHWHERV